MEDKIKVIRADFRKTKEELTKEDKNSLKDLFKKLEKSKEYHVFCAFNDGNEDYVVSCYIKQGEITIDDFIKSFMLSMAKTKEELDKYYGR